MLRPSKDLQHLALVARDDATHDAVGDVKNLFFDDAACATRYLVVETALWLFSRKVLISPIGTGPGKPHGAAKRLPALLTREQIKNSPGIDTDRPVTRQHETDCLDRYSYPYCLEVAVFKHHGRTGYWPGAGSAAASASDRAVFSHGV